MMFLGGIRESLNDERRLVKVLEMWPRAESNCYLKFRKRVKAELKRYVYLCLILPLCIWERD